ncbi:uncharacterized protein LOC113360399 [Papaver somniferum]|uniref:uncharacterized protein LOC113360399 n=1 Tax=Papaver somniferum TaxID=3469 RepID=UPI000E701538|nr:uncharacterized protein LOC113360399 [Papaver somniferum]
MDDIGNPLIMQEMDYDKLKLQEEFDRLRKGLNPEQEDIYEIINSVDKEDGGLFFVYGSGGTGKTYLWNTIISSLHARLHVQLDANGLIYGSSCVSYQLLSTFTGIESLLLPGGRTAHSRFKIPLKPNETSSCNVIMQDDLAMLLKKTNLIIWDEAPMVHRHAFEAVNKTMIDIMSTDGDVTNTPPFGGKTVVLGGDFTKILPVVTKGSREQIVDASISRSPLWEKFKIFELTRNMRLSNSDANPVEQQKIREFSKWVLDIGDGKIPATAINESEEKIWIQILDDLLIRCDQDHLHKMVETMYPGLLANTHDHEYLRNRSILAPTNKSVKEINDHVLAMIPEEEYELLSADSIDPESDNYQSTVVFYPKEFLNEMEVSGLPSHKLYLKVGVSIMLLRNIDQAEGLCNGTGTGTRMVVKEVGKNVIHAVAVTGKAAGRTVLIPRIVMTLSETDHPFILRRRLFPLKVCFAMKVNKSQGQSLPNVGICLDEPVFSHGQLYVAVDRICHGILD